MSIRPNQFWGGGKSVQGLRLDSFGKAETLYMS